MEGFLWLLLQVLPLLTAAAFVFFALGWRWRGQNLIGDDHNQSKNVDDQDIQTETARKELNAAHELERKLRQKLEDTQAELQESQARETHLQKEILRLSDELKRLKTLETVVSTGALKDSSPSVDTDPVKKAFRKAAKKAIKGKKRPSK